MSFLPASASMRTRQVTSPAAAGTGTTVRSVAREEDDCAKADVEQFTADHSVPPLIEVQVKRGEDAGASKFAQGTSGSCGRLALAAGDEKLDSTSPPPNRGEPSELSVVGDDT